MPYIVQESLQDQFTLLGINTGDDFFGHDKNEIKKNLATLLVESFRQNMVISISFHRAPAIERMDGHCKNDCFDL
ncbi:hypothetical protein PGT21_004262 [Puccinia graminis f. sp. tritici]|uniref:Uncharacterized protein n=1 Tax=Puccinia graminis f. sp. tritici TaxID=56615 RepID=A0A5B0PAQ7_PUCGR|nr:hypothetical protein PGT21_004262 [Puccinia graminis f. sp. tritici]